MHEQILNFWFTEIEPKHWWTADPAFDTLIRKRFQSTLNQATRCELYTWRQTPQGRLAEIIVLDQFSRNIYRNTPQAFANDAQALTLAQEAVAQGMLESLQSEERAFLLLPYMHSESPRIHAVAEPLFKAWTPAGNYDFELRHKAIIDRFGRYPHRNLILGRDSSADEIEFLKQPGSSF